MEVTIDGIDYVPRCEIDAVTDAKAAKLCHTILTALFLYGEDHGRSLRWSLMESLEIVSPDLYELAKHDISDALDRVREPDE